MIFRVLLFLFIKCLTADGRNLLMLLSHIVKRINQVESELNSLKNLKTVGDISRQIKHNNNFFDQIHHSHQPTVDLRGNQKKFVEKQYYHKNNYFSQKSLLQSNNTHQPTTNIEPLYHKQIEPTINQINNSYLQFQQSPRIRITFNLNNIIYNIEERSVIDSQGNIIQFNLTPTPYSPFNNEIETFVQSQPIQTSSLPQNQYFPSIFPSNYEWK